MPNRLQPCLVARRRKKVTSMAAEDTISMHRAPIPEEEPIPGDEPERDEDPVPHQDPVIREPDQAPPLQAEMMR